MQVRMTASRGVWMKRSAKIAHAAVAQPTIGKIPRPQRRQPVRRTTRSESHPPSKHVMPAKNCGAPVFSSDFSKETWSCSSKYLGSQLTKKEYPKLPKK